MKPTDRLGELVRSFEHSSWRWECQGHYAVDEAKLQRWRDGAPPDLEAKRPWLDYIRGLRASGKTFERVRMLTEPLTEYLRWMLEQTQDTSTRVRISGGSRRRRPVSSRCQDTIFT